MLSHTKELDTAVSTKLFELLCRVRETSGTAFTGLGVLVSNASENLPLSPLRPEGHPLDDCTLVEFLSEISKDSSDLHDGFHLLSSDFKVRSTSLYFAAPILPDFRVNGCRRVGARFLTALFGSALDNVIATGVASPSYGVAVFQRGSEVIGRP